jgi:hypothetical protein
MEEIKGGRGKKAPYETTHCRIPKPIKLEVELLAGAYRDLVAAGKDPKELLEVVEAAITEIFQPEKAGTKHREKALRLKLEKMTADRDALLIRFSEAHTRNLQEIKRIYDEANRKNEQLEAYNQQIDRANGYLESENRKLRQQLAELQSKVCAPE